MSAAPIHTFLADASTAERMARADFWLRFRGLLPAMMMFAAYAVLAVFVGALFSLPFIAFLGAVFALLALSSVVSGVFLFRRIRASAQTLYPAGAEFSAEYGPVLTLRSPGRETHLPYPAITALRRRRDAVLLANPTQASYVLPSELCPPEAYRFLTAARLGGAPVPDAAGYPVSVEPDRAFVGAITRRLFHRVLVEPSLWITGLAILVMIVGFPVLGGWPLWGALVFGVVMVVIVAGATALVVPLAGSRMRASFRGIRIFARFEADDFSLLDRGVATRRRYDTVEEIQLLGPAVELRCTGSVDPELFPAALFPAEVLARLGARPIS